MSDLSSTISTGFSNFRNAFSLSTGLWPQITSLKRAAMDAGEDSDKGKLIMAKHKAMHLFYELLSTMEAEDFIGPWKTLKNIRQIMTA
jgi:hypothetical protein